MRQRRALALLLLGVAACAGLEAAGPRGPDPRMLRATIGPGRERLALEIDSERAVFQAITGHGIPDYVWAPAGHELVLLFLAADRALHFGGPSGARRLVESLSPIPEDWLDRTAPDDRDEVRARRREGPQRLAATPPGFCADGDVPPPPPPACGRDPAARALVDEVREKVLAAWESPDALAAWGGERVLVRFRIAATGALAERCALGATSPSAAATALAAFDAVFPVAPLRGGAACLADVPLGMRFEIAPE